MTCPLNALRWLLNQPDIKNADKQTLCNYINRYKIDSDEVVIIDPEYTDPKYFKYLEEIKQLLKRVLSGRKMPDLADHKDINSLIDLIKFAAY